MARYEWEHEGSGMLTLRSSLSYPLTLITAMNFYGERLLVSHSISPSTSRTRMSLTPAASASGQTARDTVAPRFLLEIDVSKWRNLADNVLQ